MQKAVEENERERRTAERALKRAAQKEEKDKKVYKTHTHTHTHIYLFIKIVSTLRNF